MSDKTDEVPSAKPHVAAAEKSVRELFDRAAARAPPPSAELRERITRRASEQVAAADLGNLVLVRMWQVVVQLFSFFVRRQPEIESKQEEGAQND